jgi:ferritin-like metal-binding protein YciE
MRNGSLKELYLDELADLYDAETQTILALPRLRDAARAPELREALTRQCEESRLHLERLQLLFTHWRTPDTAQHCAGLAGIVQEADNRVNGMTTGDPRDAAIASVALRMAHYELAAYAAARIFARRLNRPDEARLLQETLDEDARLVRHLLTIAETGTPAGRSEILVRATPPHGDALG